MRSVRNSVAGIAERRIRIGTAVLLTGLAIGVAITLAVRWYRVNRCATAARKAVAQGRYAEARAPLARWLRLAPKDAEAHYLRSRVGLALGLQDEMTAGDKKARELGYPKSELALLRAILAAKQGHGADSEPILREAFARKRGPDALLDEALAQVYLETYNLTQAYAVIDCWMREAPTDARPYLWRAEIDNRFVGREVDLLGDYREALRRDPGLAKARLGLAQKLSVVHRYDEAAKEFDTYLKLRPDDVEGWLGAGRNALKRGDSSAAASHFERALRLNPNNAAAHKGLGDIATFRQQDAEALAHFDEAIRHDPFELDYRYARGLVLYRLARFEEADAEREATNRLRAEYEVLNNLQERLRQKPNDAAVEIQLARWLYTHGKEKEGLRWASKVLKEQPHHRDASNLLAEHYQNHGNPGLANYYRLNASNGQPEPAPR